MQPRDIHSIPEDEETSPRKRVCKACDRCRLKKSKCDGTSPCNRCQSDNAICVFGERKKSHDKVYPKGYVEMLEQQQEKLVNALQDLYHRSVKKTGWPGPALRATTTGIPLTHDILERLGLLKLDDQGHYETFEENVDVLRNRMIKEEELAYPTPTTTQSEFSPVNSTFEAFVQRPLASGKARSGTGYQLTPPMHSPEEDTSMTFPESALTMGSSMNLDGPSLRSPGPPWLPNVPPQFVPEMGYNYDVLSSYHRMGLMEQKVVNPCLPVVPQWNDEEIGALGLGPIIS